MALDNPREIASGWGLYKRMTPNAFTVDGDEIDIDHMPIALLVNPDNPKEVVALDWREDGMMLMDGEFYDVDVVAWGISDILRGEE